MPRISSNGVALETRVGGDGIPVLLLHGFTGRGSSWSPFLLALHRGGHRTVVVDLLGHGRSDAPADPARYALGCQVEDLAMLLHALHASPADLVGYSMGARIALRFALDHPAAVRRLVLESPSAGIADQAERRRRQAADESIARLIDRDGVSAFVDRWEAQSVFGTHVSLGPAVRQRLRRGRLAQRGTGLAASLRGAGQGVMEPVHDRLSALRIPTLVVCGELDAAGRDRAAAIADAIPGARLEVVPGVGHSPHLEDPLTFRRLLVDFLGEASSNG